MSQGKATMSDLRTFPNPEVVQIQTEASVEGLSSQTSQLASLDPAAHVPPPPKRSRKQQIQPRLSDDLVSLSSSDSRNNTVGKKKKKRVKKDDETPSSSEAPVKPLKKKKLKRVAPTLGEKTAKKSKIVLNRSELINPELTFTVFPDSTRPGICAIGSPQCILAAERHHESGSLKHFRNYNRACKAAGKKPNHKLFSNYLSAPHFLLLTDLWNSAQPLSRIVKFSSLERFTNGSQLNQNASVYRFSGSIYQNQVPESSPPLPEDFQSQTLIIKHPIFRFYSSNPYILRFLVLKRIHVQNLNAEVAVPVIKVLKLKRSNDYKNVEITVEEDEFPWTISDVNAMSQRNIQPVIHTSGGLLPLLTNRPTDVQYIQQSGHEHQSQMPFDYLRCQYETVSELVPVEESAVNNGLVIAGDGSYTLQDASTTSTESYVTAVRLGDDSGDPLQNSVLQKPGFLAVCPHCGSCSNSLIRCARCRLEFPANVKLVEQEFAVDKKQVIVAVAKSIGSEVPSNNASKSITQTSKTNSGKPLTVVSASSSTKPVEKTQQARKIIAINKPSLIDSSLSHNNNNKALVQAQIQPDGGSAVIIDNRPSAASSSTVIRKPPIAPKKRAPPRKKQQECITLSSDDEEPEPPKPKVSKSEEVTTTPSAPVPRPAILKPLAGSTNQETSTNPDQSQEKASVEQIKVNDEMPKQVGKGLKININLQDDVQPKKKEDDSVDPMSVLAKIDKEKNALAAKFKYATINARSVSVGSYKVTNSYTGFAIAVQLTELGITFTLPHANYRHKMVQVCIPMKSIINVKISNQSGLSVIFISTGPKYAKWVRDALGLDGSPDKEGSNYYCPLNGQSASQKTITIVGDDPFPPADFGIIKALCKDMLEDIDYQKASSLLMQMTPSSYKSSISYNTGSSPESSSDVSVPMIVSTRSIRDDETIPANSSSSTEKKDYTETNVTRGKDNDNEATTRAAVAVSSGTSSLNQDPNGVILFYEGINNIKMPISPPDIRCLGYEQFLNDQIIDFWLAVIQTEILRDEDRERTFIFDSFFYSKLTEKIRKRTADDAALSASEGRHVRVKKRTKNVDIFEKDFLIVPINENYHWFLAIICFPGLQGYYDYDTLTPLPNHKGAPKPRTTKTAARAKPKPIVYNQPKNESTASYGNRDEAPEDPDEMDTASSPEDANTEADKTSKGAEAGDNPKPKSDAVRVKHPCILIFDSLTDESRRRIFSTLREYLKVEYKTKKKAEREFDENTIPGVMPKVPQQPNFSDCGLFMLQYVESFFSTPPETFDANVINLTNWFPSSIAENKRREIYQFIFNRIQEKFPQNVSRIPEVSFEAGANDLGNDDDDDDDEDNAMHSTGSEELFDDEDVEDSDVIMLEELSVKKKKYNIQI